MKRTNKQLEEIDSHLKTRYSLDGAQACADYLNEPVDYIKRKARQMRLKQPHPLISEIADQKRFNSELRIENTKLIVRNKKLIKIVVKLANCENCFIKHGLLCPSCSRNNTPEQEIELTDNWRFGE